MSKAEKETVFTLEGSRSKEFYLDVLRSAAMIFVVLLHSVSPFYTLGGMYGTKTWWVISCMNFIGRIGVPVFFMISGYLALTDARTMDIKSFYRKRIGRLVAPLVVWNVVYFFFNHVWYGHALDGMTFLTQFFAQGSKYHLWYLYQIIAIYLLAPFLKRIVDHCRMKEIILLFGLILLQPTIFHFINTVQETVAITPFRALMEGYAGFFLYGYILGKVELSNKWRWLIYIGGIAGFLLGVFGNHSAASPDYMALPWNAGYAVVHYLTSGACFVFVKSWLKNRPKSPAVWKNNLMAGVSRFAKWTFGVYLLHVLFLNCFTYLLQRAGIDMSPALQVVYSFLFAIVGSTLLSAVFSKIPFLRRLV